MEGLWTGTGPDCAPCSRGTAASAGQGVAGPVRLAGSLAVPVRVRNRPQGGSRAAGRGAIG